MASKTLNDFTLSGIAASNDFLVGFDTAVAGGERKWTVATIANAVSGVMTPQLNNAFFNSTDVIPIAKGGTERTTGFAGLTSLAGTVPPTINTYLKVNGSNNGLTYDVIDLNSGDVTGILPVSKGGTGGTTGSSGVTADILLVAGGGAGGGYAYAGGGGAGGLLQQTMSPLVGILYTIVIGAGGPSESISSSENDPGKDGGHSYITGQGIYMYAQGGGGGGCYRGDNNYIGHGRPGGSGGGCGGYNTPSGVPRAQSVSGQGKTGGLPTGFYAAGGGGGAGAIGGDGDMNLAGGDGGDGLNWKSLGTYYAGGGGGGGGQSATVKSNGGLGGGGDGADGDQNLSTSGPRPGQANTGGGGGGLGGYITNATAAPISSTAGGSGIAIIRYAGTTARGAGGTISGPTGGYMYHTFITSGTFTLTS